MIELIIYILFSICFGTLGLAMYGSYVRSYFKQRFSDQNPVGQSLTLVSMYVPFAILLVSATLKLKEVVRLTSQNAEGYGWAIDSTMYYAGFIGLAFLFSGVILYCSSFISDDLKFGKQGEESRAEGALARSILFILMATTITCLIVNGYETMIDYFIPYDRLNQIN